MVTTAPIQTSAPHFTKPAAEAAALLLVAAAASPPLPDPVLPAALAAIAAGWQSGGTEDPKVPISASVMSYAE